MINSNNLSSCFDNTLLLELHLFTEVFKLSFVNGSTEYSVVFCVPIYFLFDFYKHLLAVCVNCDMFLLSYIPHLACLHNYTRSFEIIDLILEFSIRDRSSSTCLSLKRICVLVVVVEYCGKKTFAINSFSNVC